MNSIVFMYSGQGSQYYHMGAQLYEECAHFRDSMDALDYYFREYTGESVLKHVFSHTHNKADPFERMLYTHSAIYMFEYCLTKLLFRDGIEPDFYLGTSLGRDNSNDNCCWRPSKSGDTSARRSGACV